MIDDDEQVQELVRFALTSQGYQVFSALNGREGSQKAQTLLPDLVLLDMVLDDLNGVEILRLIQSHPKAKWIPVVVMTGLEDQAQVLRSALLALGVVAFMSKPFVAERLCEAVSSALAVHTHDTRRMYETGTLKHGPIRIDLKSREVCIQGRSVGKIPTSRYDLLCVMVARQGAVSKRELMYATGAENINNIEKMVQRLRTDLGPDGERVIRTVPGGYQISV
ncbi:MAG: response regulator transcription factor [Elusimicrobiota bacterium]